MDPCGHSVQASGECSTVIGRHFEAIVQDCRYCGVKQKLENGQGRGLELSINAHTASKGTIIDGVILVAGNFIGRAKV